VIDGRRQDDNDDENHDVGIVFERFFRAGFVKLKKSSLKISMTTHGFRELLVTTTMMMMGMLDPNQVHGPP
jgi:hypothetical protein